jgi:hypothetical protein
MPFDETNAPKGYKAVVATRGCDGCAFDIPHVSACLPNDPCNAKDRADQTDAIFKEVP